MREKILENIAILLEGMNDPSIFKAIFLAGGSGSGKSFVASKTTGGHGLRIVNSDDMFMALAKKAGYDIKNFDMTKMSPEQVNSFFVRSDLPRKVDDNKINEFCTELIKKHFNLAEKEIDK